MLLRMEMDWKQRVMVLQDHDWALGEIAEHCGTTYDQVWDLLNGRTKEPRGMFAVNLYRISNAFAKRKNRKPRDMTPYSP